VDEEQSRGNPEGESERRAKLVEQAILDYEFAKGGNILDGAMAVLAGN